MNLLNASRWKPVTYLVRKEDTEPIRITLDALVAAGPDGCTPIERPAPRWSGYIHQLRHRGVKIETIFERHDGHYPGTHGRYILRSHVEQLHEVAE